MTQRFNGFLGLGRRDVIKALGAAGVGLAASACSASPTQTTTANASPAASPAAATTAPDPAVENRPEAADMTPDQALQLLIDGNKRYIEGKSIHPRENIDRIRDTAVDQFPFAAFLSCADSRVPVEEVFDQGIGDCFVCRVAGNIATEQEIGSLEFGTLVLGSKVLLVIGHERCGAVVASMGRIPLPDNPGQIPTLVPLIEPAVKTIAEKVKREGVPSVGDDVDATIKLNVHNQVARLKRSPILSQLERENKLKILPAYYDLDTGVVQILEAPKA
ncbi:carbonic anhydrase [Microcoleus sp. FACHB-1515]|uniref:carbonic anhydrase n=1 Tax=Cyanophyceae TaxID=3028117 RepID=UPI0016833E94|nr:carbonic anhydrase [Microcoleus sp. FACHB-1515]MBD2091593.1 carbonic anhydrase [Microcoleus sp. FACHB-1515]